LRFAVQTEQRGTGDATATGLASLRGFKGHLLILSSDTPLLRKETLQSLKRAARNQDIAFLSALLEDPTGYGRIIHGSDKSINIVEHKDATPQERTIREINVGVYMADADFLRQSLKRITPHNVQQELYLTDIIAMAKRAKSVLLADPHEGRGINTQRELHHVEEILRRRLLYKLMDNGVTIEDLDNTFVGADTSVQSDVILGRGGVRLHGNTHVATGAIIEGPCVITNSTIQQDAHIYGFSHIEHAHIGPQASVGPFARLRPGTTLLDASKVGNFVELKNTTLGSHSKANHLAYLGDTTIQEHSNIGAGTITCNYDGINKSPTHIGNHCFVGSNSTLVAPVSIEDGAYVAAGSTITKDIPKDALAFARTRQINREGDAKRLREIQTKRKKKDT
jgi:bifunctional UDP-N-acetylglucosamine pyrophosphorylase/glucosamine-1-phosphate N-acetyltransferase